MQRIKRCARLMISIGLLVHVTFASAMAAPDAIGPEPRTLGDILKEGLENNLMLQSLRSQADALLDEVSAAGALDDPRLGVVLANIPTDTFRFDQEPMTQKQISIAQKIPWLSKLSLKTQLVVLRAKTAETQWMAERLALERKIVVAYYELALVLRSQTINAQLIEKVNRGLQSSESRYAIGKGLQQDVLQAQVEVSRLLDEQNNLADRRRTTDNKLNELLNRPVYDPIIPFGIEKLNLPDKALDSEGLKNKALAQNPQVTIRHLMVKQAGVGEELARKAFYPDFDVRLSYGQRDDDSVGNTRADFFSAGVNLNIPLWQKRKQKPKLESAIKRSQSAKKSLRNLQLQLPHNIDSLVSSMGRFNANHNLFVSTLLIQAEQWANSAQIAYEVGKLEFNSMIKAQIQLLRLNLQADTYLVRYFQKWAELKEILGEKDSGLTPGQ